MHNEKEPKKLNAEELEKRVAPAALMFDTGTEPTGSAAGTKAPGKDGGSTPPPAPKG